MDAEMDEKLTLMARKIAQEICRNHGVQMLPASTSGIQACGAVPPMANGCENLLYAKITTNKFYLGGQTDIDEVVEGKIPVAPGDFVVLSQGARPPWPAACYSLRYTLANNGTNHSDVQIEWFIDDVALDKKQFGNAIYNPDGTLIGNGMLPVPLAGGEPCCVGGNNRLRARISHRGKNNQIEGIQLFVEHARPRRCSTCATGGPCSCQKSE
jgi:hypothetical protein